MVQDSTLVRLTGLWKGQSKTGSNYLAGALSPSSKLLILPNAHKKQASDPDYIAYLAPQEKEKKEAETAQPEKDGWL